MSQDYCTPESTPPPAQDSRPMEIEPPGALCHIGQRRLLITGLIRRLMTAKFSDQANVEEPLLRQFVWREGLTTGILIESVFRWKPELVEKKPAIMIRPNASRNLRVSLADVAGMDEQTFTQYTTLWVGSHTVYAISGAAAQTEMLATETQREITQMSPAVLEFARLMRFQVTEVGEIGILEEATQNFTVPITVAWAYQESWKLRRSAPPFAGVRLEY